MPTSRPPSSCVTFRAVSPGTALGAARGQVPDASLCSRPGRGPSSPTVRIGAGGVHCTGDGGPITTSEPGFWAEAQPASPARP